MGFMLHVSDFHLKEDSEVPHPALTALAKKLNDCGYEIDYLVHTGDVIDSSDLYELIFLDQYSEQKAQDLQLYDKDNHFDSNALKEWLEKQSDKEINTFNEKLIDCTIARFERAQKVFEDFISQLNLASGRVIICCGNHDAMRLLKKGNSSCKDCTYQPVPNADLAFSPFEDFLNSFNSANSQKRNHCTEPVTFCTFRNINFLILNTNWDNPPKAKPGYYCTRCDQILEKLEGFDKSSNQNSLNIVVSHKPFYEICESARLAYKRYIKTPFMAAMQEYVGLYGFYLCGDKHTRSIVGTAFHDINHYLAGEPLTHDSVEYNLIELNGNRSGMERKIHLNKTGDEWVCTLHPQDATTTALYNHSKKYIVNYSFDIIGMSHRLPSWENICQSRNKWANQHETLSKSLNLFYSSICKYRKEGKDPVTLADLHIFDFISERIQNSINNRMYRNPLNIRGEYCSGKSTFLGLLYLHLLYQYSSGEIDFIPAYFNLEKLENSGSMHSSVNQKFEEFTKEIQKIAHKEHQPVCYIIDGLDEQDCWSNGLEGSIGEVISEILNSLDNAYYIMSFSQHRLPKFKNTMATRRYNDNSDVMYFNPVDVKAENDADPRFAHFVNEFIFTKNHSWREESFTADPNIRHMQYNLIRKFRHPTIDPDFLYRNYDYLTMQKTYADDTVSLIHGDDSVSAVQHYNLDMLHGLCLKELDYGFEKYAPPMAYLFSYKGYTYENFKQLMRVKSDQPEYNTAPIHENAEKIYDTFRFIKKNREARNYLVALQYNRELKYYAEHPTTKMDKQSILNEFLSRDIALLVRLSWRDANEFVIVYEKLLARDKGFRLSNCTYSMLVYILAHQRLYKPLRDTLKKQMDELYNDLSSELSSWKIKENVTSDETLEQFKALTLRHTLETFNSMDASDSVDLVEKLIKDEDYRLYNRQYQMLYYGDLSIRGEDTKHALQPGTDTLYKGFDFHNCFYYLFSKLKGDGDYPLREYDLFTLCDLFVSRFKEKYMTATQIKAGPPDSFFYGSIYKKQAVYILNRAKDIVLEKNLIVAKKTESVNIYFAAIQDLFEAMCKLCKAKSDEPDGKEYNNITQEMFQLFEKWDKNTHEKLSQSLTNL